MTVEIVSSSEKYPGEAVLRAFCYRCHSKKEKSIGFMTYMGSLERARAVQEFIDTLEIEGWVMAPRFLCPACVGDEN